MAVVEHEVNRHETLVEDTESKRKGGTTLHTSPNMLCTVWLYYKWQRIDLHKEIKYYIIVHD